MGIRKGKMEELLAVTKKQLRFQKIITALLLLIIVMFIGAGAVVANKVNQVTTAMTEALEQLQEIDVEGINDSISQTEEMLQSVDDFSAAVDDVTESMQEFNSWFSGMFGN